MSTLSSNNFFNATRGVLGLFGGTNKARKLDEDEADESSLPEFESKMSDEEIIVLTKQWIAEDENYSKDIRNQQKDNVNYWTGKHYNEIQVAGSKRPLVDNLMFEAVETFLPIATRSNPEPVVASTGGQQDDITRVVRQTLVYQADRQHLRMKLKGMTRGWSLYLIGVLRVGWSNEHNDIETKVVLPSRMIFDPKAEIGSGGEYYGDFLGEKKRATARKLARMFPKKEALIKAKCNGNMGARLVYIQWHTRTDLFFTIDGSVLGKFKNPDWNYDGTVETVDPVTGEKSTEEIRGRNHFAHPEYPYIFLSIFNLGRRPHDETSLMYQNIPLQDLINKRYMQMDKNVDGQNNGIVLSGKSFTKEQAAEAATQLARGNPLWVPDGNIEGSYKRDIPASLAPDVYRHLEDARNELRNIFGTSGSTPQGTEDQKTVRGKILINQLDASRIGGGVTEFIERVAATVYNHWVQLMYVYYTEERVFPILGSSQGEEYTRIVNTMLSDSRLHVTVKDGSLIPKDPLTQRNEAMDLWSAQAIDPITLYKRLDFPNPQQSAQDLLTWQMIQQGKLSPQVMFPEFQVPPPIMPTAVPQGSQTVSGEEAGAEVNPTNAPENKSQQLLGAVPLQG